MVSPHASSPAVAGGTAVIEWYRVDRSQGMRRALLAAAGAMATGSLVVGLSFLTRQPPSMRIAAAVVGFVAVVAGPLIAILGLRRSLTEDLYVVLRADGVVLHLEEPETVMPWESIARVRHDPAARAVVFTLRSGELQTLTTPFAGITTEALARRLDECRRKADFKLLR
jgi:hypothetical protein